MICLEMISNVGDGAFEVQNSLNGSTVSLTVLVSAQKTCVESHHWHSHIFTLTTASFVLRRLRSMRWSATDGQAQKLLGTPSTEYRACRSSSDTCETASSKGDLSVWTEGAAERVRYCLFLVQFMQQMAFTGIIVDSYQVSKLLGASPAFSGLLVGLFMTGGAVGTSAMTLVLHLLPDAWKEFRAIVLTCQTMDTIGALLYTTFIHLAVHGISSGSVYSIACVRFLWGLGSGFTGQLAGVTITKVTPPNELPEQMQTLQFWQTLGLGHVENSGPDRGRTQAPIIGFV